MTNCSPLSEPDTAQLRARLREIRNEKSLLDDIEDDLEYTRAKEDKERKKKREQEDADIVRKRSVADHRREARQEKLCEQEIVSFRSILGLVNTNNSFHRRSERSSRLANHRRILDSRHLLLYLTYVPVMRLGTQTPSTQAKASGTNVPELVELWQQ